MSDNDKKLNVLFVSGECLPFCANGGVADMCFALPKYLHKTGKVDVRVKNFFGEVVYKGSKKFKADKKADKKSTKKGNK